MCRRHAELHVLCAHEGSGLIPCVSVDPLTPSSTVRAVIKAAELWVGGCGEIFRRHVKDRDRHEGATSQWM